MKTLTTILVIIVVWAVLDTAIGFASWRKERKPGILERDLLAREELEAKLDQLEQENHAYRIEILERESEELKRLDALRDEWEERVNAQK